MRLSFILIGDLVISRFQVVLPILGLILIYSGIKLSVKGDTDVDPEHNIILRIARKIFPIAKGDHGHRFFVRDAGKLAATPLFLVLLVVESTDLVFAVDSVPTIFGLVRQSADYFTFVVFTSNIFAILGLRALYFLLAGMMNMFRYLAYGLSAILVLVGVKLIAEYLAHWQGWSAKGEHLVPPLASLAVVISVLAISVVASIWANRRELRAQSAKG
jgi:tellurite resistance protein TerC